tara:strand:+ start:118 stop:483 length:366 start_codon:yes stop_codon:yes gene_type:complete
MSLSKLDKHNLNRLFEMLNREYIIDENVIKTEYNIYGKLNIIAKQVEFLKLQANEILEEYDLNCIVEKSECRFKKCPGNYYYLYKHNDKYILSLISNKEWNIYDNFITCVYYDYDYSYKKC